MAPPCAELLPPICPPGSGDHGRLVASRALTNVCDALGGRDQIRERFLRFDIMASRIRLIALDIDAKGCARRAGAGKAEDHAGAARKQDADTLMFADRFV